MFNLKRYRTSANPLLVSLLEHFWEYPISSHLHGDLDGFPDSQLTELQSVQQPQLQQLYRHMEMEQMHVLEPGLTAQHAHLQLAHQVTAP